MSLKNFIILAFLIIFSKFAYPQLDPKYYFGATYMKEDSVPLVMFKEVFIYADRIFKDRNEANAYYRLVRNIKRVYPLARVCQFKIDEYNEGVKKAKTEREKRLLLKKAEKELKEQYTPEIKDLTFTQGKLLLKLIYRQTGDTSYDLIKEYRGTIRAVFWQMFARIFDNDLKSKYDPYGDDKTIESIVQLIEHGVI
jgi:hypothetical protein